MKFYHKKIALEIPDRVYEPQEDSLLIAEILEGYDLKGKKCLDMGCGSGLLAILMAKKGSIVTAVDVNPEAIKITASNAKANNVKIKTIKSNLFSALNDSYDFVAFNPPYLPKSEEDNKSKSKEQWSGGKTGRDVIEKFFKHTKNHLNKNGKIIMVFSSLTGENKIQELAEKSGFSFRMIKRQKIPWEELILVELEHKHIKTGS